VHIVNSSERVSAPRSEVDRPPPPLFAALIAAISPADPPPGPEQGTRSTVDGIRGHRRSNC